MLFRLMSDGLITRAHNAHKTLLYIGTKFNICAPELAYTFFLCAIQLLSAVKKGKVVKATFWEFANVLKIFPST